MMNGKYDMYSSNRNKYDKGVDISFDKTKYSNQTLSHSQIKHLVLDVACIPTTTPINPILIADSAATGNYIFITTPHSDRQVDTYPICIRLLD